MYICILTFNLLNLMSKSPKICLTVLIHASGYKINKTEKKMCLIGSFCLESKSI